MQPFLGRLNQVHSLTYRLFHTHFNIIITSSLVAWWLEVLTISHEVTGSIPGSSVGICPCRGRSP
jgi:hypothetical protein